MTKRLKATMAWYIYDSQTLQKYSARVIFNDTKFLDNVAALNVFHFGCDVMTTLGTPLREETGNRAVARNNDDVIPCISVEIHAHTQFHRRAYKNFASTVKESRIR